MEAVWSPLLAIVSVSPVMDIAVCIADERAPSTHPCHELVYSPIKWTFETDACNLSKISVA